MTVAAVVPVVLLLLVLVWKISQLVRAPQDVPLRMVVFCLAAASASFFFSAAAGNVTKTQTSAAPMPLMWAAEMSRMLLAYGLICFFVFSTARPGPARTHARLQAIPLALTVLALTVLSLTVPSEAAPADYPASTMAPFWVISDTYALYALTISIVWARRRARKAGQRLRRALLLVWVGLSLVNLSTVLLIVGVITHHLLEQPVPHAVTTAQTIPRLSGNLLVLGGLAYPGVVVRLAAVRTWWRHLRDYRHLHVLWSLLHAAFPQNMLERGPLGLWDRVSPRGVHRRFYRRVIECRDGLVLLSPYLASSQHHGDNGLASPLASRVRRALRAHASGDPVAATATPVAVPLGTGIDADVDQLVALSNALGRDNQRRNVTTIATEVGDHRL